MRFCVRRTRVYDLCFGFVNNFRPADRIADYPSEETRSVRWREKRGKKRLVLTGCPAEIGVSGFFLFTRKEYVYLYDNDEVILKEHTNYIRKLYE